MASSDDLFQLIKAMTKTEKRYCRLFLRQRIGKEAADCLVLFDAIVKRGAYNDEELRAKLGAEPSASHFWAMKNSLCTLLLKGLCTYRQEQSNRQQLRDLLDHADLLAVKGLYSHARKLLRKARKIAARNEFVPEMITIIQLEYRIDAENAYAGQSEASLDRRRAEATEIVGKLENCLSYIDLFSRLSYSITQHGGWATAVTREKLDAIMAHPLLRSVETATTIRAKNIYFLSYVIYYVHIGDIERGYLASMEYQEFVDSNKMIVWHYEFSLHNIYFYQFTFSRMLGKRREAYRAYLSICASIKSSDPLHVKIRKEMMGVVSHIMFYDFATLVDRAPDIERFFAECGGEVDRQTRHTFILAIAFAHLMLGNHTVAAEVLHRLVNYVRGGIRIDTLICGRLLQLIAHYELGHIELLPYLWRSAYYHIRKHDVLFPFEKAMLEFIRELPDVKTERELIPGFERLREKLIELDSDVPLDLIPWLESKIERRPLRDIVEERRLVYAGEIAGE